MTASLAIFAMLDDPSGILSAQQVNNLLPALFILGFGILIGIGLMCLLLVIHFMRRDRLAQRRTPPRVEAASRDRRYSQAVFPAPTRWLAVKNGNPHSVQAALGLHKPTLCSWEEGLSAVHEQKLFISPPIAGWILVMGSKLPDPAEDVDRTFRFILGLSRKVGQVQFFSLNRVVGHHAWVQADRGAIQRAYAWAGKTLWNQGNRTRAEVDLGMKCYDYAEPAERCGFSSNDPVAANTERLPLLAARWSVDPAAIDSRMLKEAQGIAGELSRSRTR